MVNVDQTSLEQHDELAQQLGVEKLYIKREDLNPSGSHKDRGVWGMLLAHLAEGKREFVISSSGNAAISAAYFLSCHPGVNEVNDRISVDKQEDSIVDRSENGQLLQSDKLKLHIFVSPRMPEDKKQRLDEVVGDSKNIGVHTSERAKTEAFQFAKEHNYQLLRTSVDDTALEGYKSLAEEIKEQLGGTEYDVFIPTSSGTTLQGLGGNGFALHAVQTTKCQVIAKKFDADVKQSETSLSHAITDTVAHRKDAVVNAISDSNGSGWVISDSELKKARKLLEEHTDTKGASWDSLLSLAGLIKALEKGNDIKNAVLLFTGK